MMNLRKTANEINRLRELVANQKETIEKAMQVIDHQIDENIKLQAENKRLKDLVEFYKYMSSSQDDVIFPNTDERGLGEGDTPTDLSPLDL